MFVASNPAKTRLMFGHFLKMDRKDFLIFTAGFVMSAGLLAFHWKLALILLGSVVFVVGCSVALARQVFLHGEVCPARVVDADRNLIAVFADLSKTKEPNYAVKVLKQPLDRLPGGPFLGGEQLAFVALFNGRVKYQTWRDFGGYLINAGTTSEETIDRVVSSIPGERWERLNCALDQLEHPIEPGLYKV